MAAKTAPWPAVAAADSTGPYCRCGDADGPHVHCPWGGMHIHLVHGE